MLLFELTILYHFCGLEAQNLLEASCIIHRKKIKIKNKKSTDILGCTKEFFLRGILFIPPFNINTKTPTHKVGKKFMKKKKKWKSKGEEERDREKMSKDINW